MRRYRRYNRKASEKQKLSLRNFYGVRPVRLWGSDEQSQQSGQDKPAQKHRPVPDVEAQKSAISRDVGKPQHAANLCSCVRNQTLEGFRCFGCHPLATDSNNHPQNPLALFQSWTEFVILGAASPQHRKLPPRGSRPLYFAPKDSSPT
jgi:hypothetical protein